MNSLEKKSFYSFLALYIVSSTIFILLSAYWYYAAEKNALTSNQYYKLRHITDTISGKIIHSHMQGTGLNFPVLHEGVIISLIDVNKTLVYGELLEGFFPDKAEYIENETETILVSDAPQEHLGIKFVVVYSQTLSKEITRLKQMVFVVISLSIMIMIALAWVLSRIFMRPVHQKIKQIEDFVHDTAHELNTPITALSMSVSRAMKKEVYDVKILKNISISTKQLFDIYTALSYLSFESQDKDAPLLDIKKALEKSVEYYQELSESKHLTLHLKAEPFMFNIDETKIAMLFGNLVNNAIKYSHPHSQIDISLKDRVFSIQDYGIGIEKEKLSKIYERYNRETDYSGGFGIGLSIVQKITQEYNLELSVESELGKGSRFTIGFN